MRNDGKMTAIEEILLWELESYKNGEQSIDKTIENIIQHTMGIAPR